MTAIANASMRPPARRDRGFSLLEVLVAFVVLSIVVTSLFRLFSGALGNAAASEDYSRALLVAQSVLADKGSGTLAEGADSGTADDGRITWNSSVSRFDPPGVSAELTQASATLPMRLFRVEVEVVFPSPRGGERHFSLATVRMGANKSR